jgi:hypothetical protein
MKPLALSVVAGLVLAATTAAAQPSQPSPPQVAKVCVDVNGALRSPVCRAPASRLDTREDVCLCAAGREVLASVCPPGVDAPPESLATARARHDILRRRASLVGATYDGRPLCVAAPRGSRP